MKMNNSVSGNGQQNVINGGHSAGIVNGNKPLAVSGGQISSGTTIHNEAVNIYQEQPVIASPNIQPAKLKSNQIASKKMIGILGKVTNQVQRNVSGHGRKRVNYLNTTAKGNGAYRVTSTSRDPQTAHMNTFVPGDGY